MEKQPHKCHLARGYLFDIVFEKRQELSEKHWHATYEMIIFTAGSGMHYINGNLYPFSKGDVFILSPVDFHYIIPDSSSVCTNVKINISNNMYINHIDPCCKFESFPVRISLKEREAEDVFFLLSLLKEGQNFSEDVFSMNVIEDIMIKAKRSANHPATGVKSSKLRTALVFIQDNFRKDIGISDAADAVGLSPNYLSALFTKEIGTSFQKYVEDVRMEYAFHLVKFSAFSMNEICFECGYNSPAYFSKVFKKKFKKSPNDLRDGTNYLKKTV